MHYLEKAGDIYGVENSPYPDGDVGDMEKLKVFSFVGEE